MESMKKSHQNVLGEKKKHGGCRNGYEGFKGTTESQPVRRVTWPHERASDNKDQCTQ
jgi:hypothetical protein